MNNLFFYIYFIQKYKYKIIEMHSIRIDKRDDDLDSDWGLFVDIENCHFVEKPEKPIKSAKPEKPVKPVKSAKLIKKDETTEQYDDYKTNLYIYYIIISLFIYMLSFSL